MNNVENIRKPIAKSSHTINIYVEQEDTPLVYVTGSYVKPNRWAIEPMRNTISSGSQSSSYVINVIDVGSENFIYRAAASQTDINKFLETRVKSLVDIKRRALDALDRSEQERKDRLKQEADQESYA